MSYIPTHAMPRSLLELQAVLEKEPGREAAARDLRIFIRKLPETAGLPPNGVALRPHLQRLGTPASGVNPKRARNMRANIRAALRWLIGSRQSIALRHVPLSATWAALLGRLERSSGPRMALTRFARWCDQTGVVPEAVTSDTLQQFCDELARTAAVANPRRHAWLTGRAWGDAQKIVSNWPQSSIALPRIPRRETPRAAFSSEFLQDLDRYQYLVSEAAGTDKGIDRFSEYSDLPHSNNNKPYRKSTASGRIFVLRRAATLLSQAASIPLNSIKSLSDLVKPGNATAIIREYYQIKGDSPSVKNMTIALVEMTRRYMPEDEDALKRTLRLRSQSVGPKATMTENNRKFIRSVQTAQIKQLFELPSKLVRAARKAICDGAPYHRRRRALAEAQVGIAIAISLHAPPRISNLGTIRIGENLHWNSGRQGIGILSFSASETKGKRPLVLSLPPDVVSIIKCYITDILPHVRQQNIMRGGCDDMALFPGPNGIKNPRSLGNQITKTIMRNIGIRMHPHLFRHLVANIHLVRHPGDYASVQHLLGHASPETTRLFYCGEEAEAAVRHIGCCLEELKTELGISTLNNLSR